MSAAGRPSTRESRPTVSFYYDGGDNKYGGGPTGAVHYNPASEVDSNYFPYDVFRMLLRAKEGKKTLNDLKKMTPAKVIGKFKAAIG